MEINPYAIPPVLSFFIHIVLLVYLHYKSRSKMIKKAYTPFFISVIVWAGAETVMRSFIVTEENYLTSWAYPYAVLCARVMALGVIALILSGIYLSFIYPARRITPKQEKLFIYVAVIAFCLFVPVVLFTGAMVPAVLYYWAGYGSDFGPLLAYMLPPLFIFAVVIFYNFYTSYRDAKTKIEKKQIQLIAIGGLIFFVTAVPTGMLTDYMPNRNFIIPGAPAGNFYIIFMDIFLIYAAIKYKLFTVEAVVENGIKEPMVSESAKKIEEGDVVLVLSPDGRKGFETFRYLATKMPGLCITTKAPKDVRAEFEFTKLPVIWISEITTKENAIEPTKLEFEISYHIYSFLREGEKRVVYIDDLDYLSAINGFQNTHEFLKSVADEAVSKNSVLIFSVTSEAYNEQEISSIKSIASKELAEDKEGRRYPAKEFNINTGHAIMVEALGETRAELKAKIKGYKVLGVSAHFPKKFTMGFPEGTEIKSIWITETSAYEHAISPRRMEFEVSQEIISFIKENPGKGLVYIDAIPTFIVLNEFMSVLKFVKDIVDIAHEYDCKVVFELPPNLFKPEQKVLFERRMDVIYHM